jgi:hypothetical protein
MAITATVMSFAWRSAAALPRRSNLLLLPEQMLRMAPITPTPTLQAAGGPHATPLHSQRRRSHLLASLPPQLLVLLLRVARGTRLLPLPTVLTLSLPLVPLQLLLCGLLVHPERRTLTAQRQRALPRAAVAVPVPPAMLLPRLPALLVLRPAMDLLPSRRLVRLSAAVAVPRAPSSSDLLLRIIPRMGLRAVR